MMAGVECEFSGVMVAAVVAILGLGKWLRRLQQWGWEDSVGEAIKPLSGW